MQNLKNRLIGLRPQGYQIQRTGEKTEEGPMKPHENAAERVFRYL
jgi:hypothetical protein